MSKLIYLDNSGNNKDSSRGCRGYASLFYRILWKSFQRIQLVAQNKEVITQQREIIANALGAKTEEIYFTAGGSESDNWALKATAEAYGNKENNNHHNKD